MRRLAAITVVSLLPAIAGWTGYVDAGSGKYIRWYQDEVDAWLDSAGTPDVAQDLEFTAARASFATWNAVAACVHPRFVDRGLSSGFLPGPPDSGTPETARSLIIWWNDEAEWRRRHDENAIALTTLFYDVGTGKARKFDIEMADWAYHFTVDPGAPETDMENTLTHELGHALGLDHSSEPEATMYYMAPMGDIEKRTLADDDVDGLCTIYRPASTAEPLPDGGSGDGGDGCDAGSTSGLGPALALTLPLLVLTLLYGRRRG